MGGWVDGWLLEEWRLRLSQASWAGAGSELVKTSTTKVIVDIDIFPLLGDDSSRIDGDRLKNGDHQIIVTIRRFLIVPELGNLALS